MSLFPERLQRLRRWPRPVRILLAVLLALYLLYLIAGNVFLNTPLFDMVTNRKPEKFQLRNGPALTLVPGHAVLWNVHVRGQANRTVYVFSAERASAFISLPALLRREIHIPRVDAVGVRAVVERVEKAIPPPPRGNRGWTVRMDAIHSDSIRSGQFGKLLISGKASATVGFLKQMKGGPSELFDSNATFDDARIGWDGTTLLDQAHIEARASFPRHYRDDAPGLRKLGILTAELAIDGRSQAVRIDTAGARATVGTVPSTARLQGQLAMDHGTLRPGGHVVWRLPVHAGEHAKDRGLLALQLDVADDIRVQARLPRDEASGSELDADLHIAGREIPFHAMSGLLPRTSGQLKAAWTFDSLNWISDLIVRKPWFRLDGGGLLRADVKLVDGQLAPGSIAEIPNVAAIAEVAGVRMQGDARAQGRIVEGRTPQVHVQVDVDQFRAAPSDAPSQVLFDGRALALELSGDARLQELKEGVRARLRFNNAQVPDLTRYNRYLGNEQVKLLGGTGLISGDVELDATGRIGTGRADLSGQNARMQVAGVAMRGNALLKARVRRADFSQKQFDLGGTTVRLQDVRVADSKDAGWWGEVAVRSGHLAAAAPLSADAMADITLRDAGPLLDAFGERSSYPRWVLGLVDSGQVQASGQLRLRHGQWVVDDLQAENARLSLRGRLDLGKAGKRGDLYLRWGVLGAGVELDGKQRQWHLAGAREWYQQRPRYLPAR
ncbi:hypothetical protein ABE522_03415 [Stenotrophomonas pennii]|uniref:hypothetical protein n=1 Tax=Stenotrophomonas lacuserhaii TaxID=2760084 RepID=UPI0032080CD3